MKCSVFAAALLASVVGLLAVSSSAQDKAPSAVRVRAGGVDLPLEQVTTKDGHVYRGLIVDPMGKNAIEFIEINRPKGKPMYLVILPIERSAIASIQRSTEAERAVLRERIQSLRMHAQVEALAMESVVLTKVEHEGSEIWHHEADWFALTSTADENTTRRCIVRLGQMFLAFRHVLPPNLASADVHLRFKVFGTKDEYYRYLREQQIGIRNPAYYVAAEKLIVAGGDVRRVVDEVAKTRQRHKDISAAIEQQNRQMPDRIKQLIRELQEQNVPAAQRKKIVAATRQKWQQQQKALALKISVANRKNAAKLDEVTGAMFRRLYHEAFHAYLDNYVYNSHDYDVPTWFNEGLAQVFEAGLLEGDTLRIDAPTASSLEKLQADLKSDTPLSLAELLTADQRAFLVLHSGTDNISSRHYFYSWGLTYYLTFEKSLLGTEALDAYVAGEARDLSPLVRFERLVDMPLAKFEQQWREEMLALRSDSRETKSQPITEAVEN